MVYFFIAYFLHKEMVKLLFLTSYIKSGVFFGGGGVLLRHNCKKNQGSLPPVMNLNGTLELLAAKEKHLVRIFTPFQFAEISGFVNGG